MNYSRRQLEALGEPFGESATRLKLDGRVYGSGGGGGGQSSAPDKTTQTMELPEWARPYAKDVLAKGASLTDINQNPYQQYGGNRIAGFSPMQMQSFQGAANMDAGPQGFQENVGQYMSPYMQNVVDVEKRGAIRDYQVGNTMQQAQATQAGAFGGGREAIQRAERERGLMGTLGGIQARGAQSAFDQASNQFRQGIQQGVAVNQLQNQYGGQMQQQAQRPLDMAYQDFQTQQNYPYKQLGFMSDLVRGMPLGQQSTESIYSQGPSTVQTLAGLGGAAYGFGKSGLFGKEGGLMSSYADGGEITGGESVVRYESGGVTSQDNKDSIVEGMYSIQGLMKAKEAALARRDVDTANAIDERIAELNAIQAQSASINNGLGSAFNQIPEERQEEMMAGGGIVAFAGGGTYGKRFEESLDTLTGMQQPKAQTPEELEQGAMSRLPMLQRMMGPDVTEPFAQELKEKRAKLPEQMEKDQGLAIAAASLGLLSRRKQKGESQGQQLISGLGEAGQQFAGEVSRLKKENREADEKIRQSQLLIATAQQQRKEGMVGKALASEEKADDKRQDAFKQKVEIQGKATQLLGAAAGNELQAQTSRYATDTSAKVQRDVANKPGEFERMLSDYEKRVGRKLTPEEYKQAMTEIGAARYGARYTGPDTTFANDAKFQKDLSDRTKMLQLQKSMPGKTPAEIEALDAQIEQERLGLIEEYRQTRASGVTSKAAPGAAPAANTAVSTAPPSSPLYVTTPDGQTFRFKTQAEADKFRKQIGG